MQSMGILNANIFKSNMLKKIIEHCLCSRKSARNSFIPSSSLALRQKVGQGCLLCGLFPGSLQFRARGGASQPELCFGYKMRRLGEGQKGGDFWPTSERLPEGNNDPAQIHENYLKLERPPAAKSDVGKEHRLLKAQEVEGSVAYAKRWAWSQGHSASAMLTWPQEPQQVRDQD